MERSGGVFPSPAGITNQSSHPAKIPLLKECNTRCSFQVRVRQRQFDMRPRRGASESVPGILFRVPGFFRSIACVVIPIHVWGNK